MKSTQIKIEKNVKIPYNTGSGRLPVYPFRDMAVGDSFKVESGNDNNVRCCAISMVNRNPKMKGMKFSVRKTESGEYRCWRIA